jgi:ribosome-associated toxin RatA of RatAB toxin-antitoxin module
MNCENSIVIHAPLEKIFQTTSNLELWPKLLPHYRWIRVVKRDGNSLVVNMAARRGWLPIQWTSRFEVVSAPPELRFHHLKAFTKGMNVKWTFAQTDDGVRVRITHQLDRWYAGLLARHFIEPVASRTLAAFKSHLEGVVAAVPSGTPSLAAEDSRYYNETKS